MPHITSLDQLIRLHEGVRLMPYDDATGKPLQPGDTLRGHLTIGIGHNLSEHGLPEALVEALLDRDLSYTMADLHAQLPWVASLDIVRHAALVDMAFNLGITKLKRFTRMLGAIHDGEYRMAKKHALHSRWAKQVGPRAVRIATMLHTGQWPKE